METVLQEAEMVIAVVDTVSHVTRISIAVGDRAIANGMTVVAMAIGPSDKIMIINEV